MHDHLAKGVFPLTHTLSAHIKFICDGLTGLASCKGFEETGRLLPKRLMKFRATRVRVREELAIIILQLNSKAFN